MPTFIKTLQAFHKLQLNKYDIFTHHLQFHCFEKGAYPENVHRFCIGPINVSVRFNY